METVYFVHRNKNNLDCIELWEYIHSKGGVMFQELEQVFDNEDWRRERKKSNSYCSNLVYCLRKLKNLGALEIMQDRTPGGKFNYSLITAIKKPEIKMALPPKSVPVVCKICDNEFKKKTPGSKYHDICQECTKNKFMKSPEIECCYCNVLSARNKMKAHRGGIYHEDCLKQKHLDTIAHNASLRRKKRVCKECNVVELESKTRKYCPDCRTLRKKLEREYILSESNKQNRKCAVCDGDMTGRGGVRYCGNNSCAAIFFAKENSNFSGRKGDSNSNVNVIKRKIIGLSCIVCDYSKVIHYHHVIERANGGLDVLNNFISLCPNHHAEIHHCGLDVAEYHKKILQRIEDIKNGIIVIE